MRNSKDDFQIRVKLLIIDFQLWLFAFLFFIYIPGRVFVAYEFFRDFAQEIAIVFYFVFFIVFDFKFKKTLAMRIFKYHLIIPIATDFRAIIKYEVLRMIDVFVSPIYFISSFFSDKKGRLFLMERYTNIKLEKDNDGL